MKNTAYIATRSIELNKFNNVQNFVSALEGDGYVFIDSNSFRNLQEENHQIISDKDKSEFVESWRNLELDRFMSDNGTYRTRRHATFTTEGNSQNYSKNDYQPHYQTTEYNGLNGGIERFYKEIDPNTLKNPIFNSLIQLAYSAFDKGKMKKWYIEAHQFRIEAKDQSNGKPTPEGIHRDGVDYVLMAMVNKESVVGGVTTIYDLDKNKLASFELENFLDIAMVNDHDVYHGVSEIYPKDNNDNKVGSRDVLVVTFKEIDK